MDCNFQVGDNVVCVNARGWDSTFCAIARPCEGDVYTIREVYEFLGVIGIHLVEISNPTNQYGEPGFMPWRFRPVRKTDISVFERMLINLPIMEDAR